MAGSYYLDTSIWLDFFEMRDEPNFPKGRWAQELIEKIIKENLRILYSDHNLVELAVVGYSHEEINALLGRLRPILIFVEATEKQIGRARDLAAKRNIPKGDALHALIARDNKAILVSFDKHFQELKDMIQPKMPQGLIGQ